MKNHLFFQNLEAEGSLRSKAAEPAEAALRSRSFEAAEAALRSRSFEAAARSGAAFAILASAFVSAF